MFETRKFPLRSTTTMGMAHDGIKEQQNMDYDYLDAWV
jgi:hypothetical protein